MTDTVLLGRGKDILSVSEDMWLRHLADAPAHNQKRLAFMTEDHRRVRYFVVRELPRLGKPIPPSFISQELDIDGDVLKDILDELEKNLVFLVRNNVGEVAWAFPVTADATAHRIRFSSGEQIFGAWAEDAIAAPFVQGHLRQERLIFDIHSVCGHCARSLHIRIGSDLSYDYREENARPLVFSPDVDWDHFSEPNIIDAYWRNSLFFWSEDHAREYRATIDQVNGIYLTLNQIAKMTPVSQGSLFGF